MASKRKGGERESTDHKRVKKDSGTNENKDENIKKITKENLKNKKTRVVNLKGRKPQIIKEGEVYCGRNMYMGGWKLKQSKFYNPFKVGKDGDLDTVIKKYREYLEEKEELRKQVKEELKGKVLACWCAPAKCHCDVLAEYADNN